jgi:hypothetical protein
VAYSEGRGKSCSPLKLQHTEEKMKTKFFYAGALALCAIALVACAAPTPTTLPPKPIQPTQLPAPTPEPPTPAAIPLTSTPMPAPTFDLAPTLSAILTRNAPTLSAIRTEAAVTVQAKISAATQEMSGLAVGTKAPDFTLMDVTGKTVSLAEEVAKHKSVVLVFYRGEW